MHLHIASLLTVTIKREQVTEEKNGIGRKQMQASFLVGTLSLLVLAGGVAAALGND